MSGLNRSNVTWEFLRVLIVDDNKFFRTLIRTVLRQFGIREIHEVENGKEASGLLSKSQVDFVLLDWDMPVWCGARFMTEARDEFGRTNLGQAAVIVIAENTTRKMVEEAAGLGVDSILCKPIVPKLLMRRMTDVLDGRSLKKEVAIDENLTSCEQGLLEKSDMLTKSVFVI